MPHRFAWGLTVAGKPQISGVSCYALLAKAVACALSLPVVMSFPEHSFNLVFCSLIKEIMCNAELLS